MSDLSYTTKLAEDSPWIDMAKKIEMAELIAEAAACVQKLLDRGVPLERIPSAAMLSRVAEGTVLPELVAAFLYSPNLDLVAKLPPSDQARIVKDPMVEVAVPVGEVW